MGNNDNDKDNKSDNYKSNNVIDSNKSNFIGVNRVIILIMIIIVKEIMNTELLKYNKVSKIKGMNK